MMRSIGRKTWIYCSPTLASLFNGVCWVARRMEWFDGNAHNNHSCRFGWKWETWREGHATYARFGLIDITFESRADAIARNREYKEQTGKAFPGGLFPLM